MPRPPAPTLRRSHALFPDAAETEARILAAAFDLFVEKGFDGTSVPEIARHARVATGTLYVHFRSKAHLVNALLARLRRALAEEIELALTGTRTVREEFEALWSVFARMLLERPRVAAFCELHHHAPYAAAEAEEAWAPAVRRMEAHFQRGRRQGVYADLPARALHAVVAGVMIGASKFARAGQLTPTRGLLLRLREAAWRAITRPVPEATS